MLKEYFLETSSNPCHFFCSVELIGHLYLQYHTPERGMKLPNKYFTCELIQFLNLKSSEAVHYFPNLLFQTNLAEVHKAEV